VRRFLVLLVTLVLLCGFAGGADANPPASQQADYSHSWRGVTFVRGLDSCPLFGAPPRLYVLRDVDLTDRIRSAYTPHNGPLFQIDSYGTVHGVINAPDGSYSVAGVELREHRIGDLAPRYFSGTGDVTISGPHGTVAGRATFQDLVEFPPPEFDLLFTRITTCNLH
jgi:hypothetical protein